MTWEKVGPGFWQRGADGVLRPAGPDLPDVVMSRRVEDFPGGAAPRGAIVIHCETCRALIAWDGKFPNCAHRCMQCCGVQPLPIEGSS